MLYNRRFIVNIHVRECMGTTFATQKQRIALTIVTGIFCFLGYTHQTTIRVLALTCTDTLTYNGTTGILTDVNHLGTRIGLLVVIRYSYRIEFGYRVVSGQDTARIFPRNGRTGFHLRPAQLTVYPLTMSTFGHKVVDTSLTFSITRIPVLYGRVFHFRTIVYHDFNDSCMKLVFVTLWSGTTFQIGYIAIIIGHDQRTFELTGIRRIDTEISRKFHRTTDTLRDIHERAVAEYRRVQGSIEIIAIVHYRTEVFLDQVRMFPNRLTERTEDDTLLHECFTESGLDRYRVHHGIHRHATERHLFFQRNT